MKSGKFLNYLACIIKQELNSFALLVHDVIFIPKKLKPMNWIMEMNLVNLENVIFFKIAYYWLSMIFQCFCQYVSMDSICYLLYRFCQTKRKTISGDWVCYCQVNTYEQYSLNIPRQQAAFGYGKMCFVHI